MLKKFERSEERPKLIRVNILESETMASVVGTVDSGMTIWVVAAAITPPMVGQIAHTSSTLNFNLLIDFYASGGGSGSRSGGFRDSGPRREEYDAGDDEVRSPRTSTSTTTRSNSVRAAPTRPSATPTSTAHPPAPAPAPAPVVDLLGGLDDDFGPPVSGAPVGKPAPNAGLDGTHSPVLGTVFIRLC